jgi:hypothetical protein
VVDVEVNVDVEVEDVVGELIGMVELEEEVEVVVLAPWNDMPA